jgi:hypothetical protein
MEKTPVRIQRKRTKGWKMPENTVSVTRPGKFGNPYKVDEKNGMDRELAYESFRLLYCQDHPEFVEMVKRELKGKNLACFCPLNKKCHADILLKIANP